MIDYTKNKPVTIESWAWAVPTPDFVGKDLRTELEELVSLANQQGLYQAAGHVKLMMELADAL